MLTRINNAQVEIKSSPSLTRIINARERRELYSDKFIRQKLNYIHMNPVKAGIVSQPHYYRLSSASDESPIPVLEWK